MMRWQSCRITCPATRRLISPSPPLPPVEAAMLPPTNLWREFMPQAFPRDRRLPSAAEDHNMTAIERPFGSAARHVSQLSVAPLRCSNASADAVMGTVEKARTIAGLRGG